MSYESVDALQQVLVEKIFHYAEDRKKAAGRALADGTLYHKPYVELLDETIKSNDPAMLRDFILSVGVVSNHGNWFTALVEVSGTG